MPKALRRAVFASAVVCALAGWNTSARAADPPAHATTDDVGKAREAYERGARASKAGDYPRAAVEFARADELAPSPTALEAALDAAVLADDAALGAALLERSKREPVTGTLGESVAAAHAKFDGRGGFMRVACANPPCKIMLDGKDVDGQKPVWATKGAHAVVREDATGTKTTMLAEVKPDTTVDVAPAPPAPPAPPPPKEEGRKKLPPFVFWAGLGVTAVAGAATLAFGVDANGTHGDFERAGCTRGLAPTNSCVVLKSDGESAETRANIALVSTLVLAAAVAVVGLYFIDWGGHSSAQGASRRGHTRRAWPLSFPALTF